MMFGSGDSFPYFECLECGCLQISEFPSDISRYYPGNYYSIARPPYEEGGLHSVLKRIRNGYALSGRGLLGRLLNLAFPYPKPGARGWLSKPGLSRQSRILDVGCGTGELLCDLATLGYQNLLGIDPFLERDASYPNGVTVLRRTIHEVQEEGPFDLVMLHHSLEHIPDQEETMASIARLLSSEGYCLIRVPVAASYAWERYRENWVQLDAPRHFFLHTAKSMQLLAARTGLALVEVEYDSNEIQFIGSEMYERGIPLHSGGKIYSRRQIRRFRAQARRLNSECRGDQAAFVFRRGKSAAGS